MTAPPDPSAPWDARCWCGASSPRAPFTADYVRCTACETLVCTSPSVGGVGRVVDDASDFYGAQYWTRFQTEEHGLPTIAERSRLDLPERCLHWLRALLAYRRPPARLLEIGGAHGGFLRLASLAGFDATGVEMSPSIVDFARRTFGVDMRVGPLGAVGFPGEAFDVVAAFDVLEHFRDPAAALREIRRVLRPQGIVLIQTPQYSGRDAHDLVAAHDRFLEHLSSPEHVYLFSRRSVSELLVRTGFPHVTFVPAIFAFDMFLIAGVDVTEAGSPQDVARTLSSTADGRLALALLDLHERAERLDVVAAERLRVIEGLKEACDERLAVIERLDQELAKHR